MAPGIQDSRLAAAITSLTVALDLVVAAGVSPFDGADAVAVVQALEVQQRRLRALQVQVLDRIQQSGFHRNGGHASAKVMVRHVARLSNGEAHRRASIARALRDLPAVAAGYSAGLLGDCQAACIARAHANTRVRERVNRRDQELCDLAATEPFNVFSARLDAWVRLMDEDGTCTDAERSHTNRDCRHIQNFNGSWQTTIHHGTLQGAQFHTLFEHFTRAELMADWAQARALHGPDATTDQLPRTDAQRRYDAFTTLCNQALTTTGVAGGPGSAVTTHVVIGAELFERTINRIHGQPVNPLDLPIVPTDPWAYQCSTLDGHPIDPTETTANALTGHVRRVIMGADSVVTDLSRRTRLFQNSAALAVKLGKDTCYWPGCWTPTTRSQLDHLHPWEHGGTTNPQNGAPACGKHNRLKQHGYTVHRNPNGTYHITKPDGTPLE